MDYNRDLRAALDKHMVQGTWTIVDRGEGNTMEISGVLKANQVKIHLHGGSRSVLATMEGLIRALVDTGRLPPA